MTLYCEDYKNICPVIAINVLGFNYINDEEDFYNCYRMKNRKNGAEMPGAEVFEINYAELPKLPKDAGGDLFTAWLKFLAAKTEEDLNMLTKQSPVLESAVNKLVQVNANEKLRRKMEALELAGFHHDVSMEACWEEGREEGREEERANLIARMLARGYNHAEVAEFTGLPIEVVKKY